ncbi:MAG: hypothetical protein JW841_09040 [Deltaproteobacteria bacterium]|nr:hypothetical protein [Deltaproteobacteria bacterium]
MSDTGIVIIGSAAGIIFFIWLGGIITRISGTWHDGKRTIVFKQWGPLVRGLCNIDGGQESYSGFAFFGRVRLERYATGKAYFLAAGFNEQMIAFLKQEALAGFKFKLRDNKLTGTFSGYKFSFGYQPTRILRVTRMVGEPREWRR